MFVVWGDGASQEGLSLLEGQGLDQVGMSKHSQIRREPVPFINRETNSSFQIFQELQVREPIHKKTY